MALLDVLRQAQREREAKRQESQPPESFRPVGARSVAEALPFLAMTLEEFQARGALLEVRVPWLEVTLWFVPTDDDVDLLMAGGMRRGRIWTASELMQLLAIAGGTPETVSTITHAKLATDGEVVAIRRRT